MRREYARIAAAHARGEAPSRLPLAEARANALKLDWAGKYGRRSRVSRHARFSDITICRTVGYIDWTPFFPTWELAGTFPAILDDARWSARRRAAFMPTRRRCCGRSSPSDGSARAVIGLWPANSDGDDISLFADEARRMPIATLHTLRQQLRAPRRPRQSGARRFRRAARERACRLYRRIRGHRRNRRGGDRRALQARQ